MLATRSLWHLHAVIIYLTHQAMSVYSSHGFRQHPRHLARAAIKYFAILKPASRSWQRSDGRTASSARAVALSGVDLRMSTSPTMEVPGLQGNSSPSRSAAS